MFSGATCLSCAAHALDLGPEPLVDDQHAGARLVEHAGERLAAQARVDAEQRQPGVAAAAVEREQLEMVLEQHRDVAGTLRRRSRRAGGGGSAPSRTDSSRKRR